MPYEPRLFSRNCAASRYLRCSCPQHGPPATRSRRGADFRGVHAAHPAVMLTSAQFFTRIRHKTTRLTPEYHARNCSPIFYIHSDAMF
ncbi:hypothetical protein D5081_00135 [Pectobacterium carotovorum]|nr:hypothetical protein D5081_00135 [Pectobacterium carotovorum]